MKKITILFICLHLIGNVYSQTNTKKSTITDLNRISIGSGVPDEPIDMLTNDNVKKGSNVFVDVICTLMGFGPRYDMIRNSKRILNIDVYYANSGQPSMLICSGTITDVSTCISNSFGLGTPGNYIFVFTYIENGVTLVNTTLYNS